MNIYTIYSKQNDPNNFEDIILVKEGFSWLGAFLQVLYALYNKMWLAAIVLLVVNIFLKILESRNYIDSGIIAAINSGIFLYVGASFNDWYRNDLIRKGYIFQEVISAPNEDEASYKYITDMLRCSTFKAGNNSPELVY